MRVITYIGIYLLLLSSHFAWAGADSTQPKELEYRELEYKVKAALIYNLSKFIDWPKSAFLSPSSPFIIGVVGSSPLLKILQKIPKNKTIQKRRIEVKQIKDKKDIQSTHLLFIDESEAEHLKEHLSGTQGNSIVTISDVQNFTNQGGIIGLFLKNNRVQYSINITAADLAHVKVNSELVNKSTH